VFIRGACVDLCYEIATQSRSKGYDTIRRDRQAATEMVSQHLDRIEAEVIAARRQLFDSSLTETRHAPRSGYVA
jgi:hypothetical protein